MKKARTRTFPIIDALGGRETVVAVMRELGFSANPDQLLNRHLDRKSLSAETMRFLMAMADKAEVQYTLADFSYCDDQDEEVAA